MGQNKNPGIPRYLNISALLKSFCYNYLGIARIRTGIARYQCKATWLRIPLMIGLYSKRKRMQREKGDQHVSWSGIRQQRKMILSTQELKEACLLTS
jgi:hypothetical protein